MTELGDLLELLHGAGGRWRTAAVAVHRWCDSEQAAIAWRRAAERQHGHGTAVTARGSGPSVWEMETRVWIDRPGDRSRQETSGPHGDTLTVCVGRTWWSYHPHIGAMSNEHEPDAGGGGPSEVEWLLDPAALIPAFDFAVAGSTEVAGRPALQAQARARPGAGWSGTPVHVADEMTLAVDRQSGVVLRAESRLEGRTFDIREVTGIEVDQPLTDGLFRFVSPDGSPVRSPSENIVRPEPVSVEEATRRASFTVLVPARLPQGWTIEVVYLPGRSRPPVAEAVVMSIHQGRMQIHQAAEPMPDGLEWSQLERDGRRMLVGEHGAKADIDGTHVRVTGNVDREALIETVAGLRPAPTGLPPFTDR